MTGMVDSRRCWWSPWVRAGPDRVVGPLSGSSEDTEGVGREEVT